MAVRISRGPPAGKRRQRRGRIGKGPFGRKRIGRPGRRIARRNYLDSRLPNLDESKSSYYPGSTTTSTVTSTTLVPVTTTTFACSGIYDQFTGPDLSPPNPALWSIVTQKVRLLNNKMNLLMDSTPNPEVDLIPVLGPGDFDIESEYEILQNVGSGDWYVVMSGWDQAAVGFCNGTYVGVMRGQWAGVDLYRLYYCSGSTIAYGVSVVTTDVSGKLRLGRVGSVWTAYYWGPGYWVPIDSWIQVTHPPGNIVQPVTFQLRDLSGSRVVEIALDNFCMNLPATTTTTTV